MGATYLTDLADVLRAAGCTVVELDGWRDRARSSGGYDGGPLAAYWHHTASAGNGAQDADYCTFSSDDAPVCNLVIGRDGVVYVCAAGATNTNGKGGPVTLPSGATIPVDGANSRVIGVEISNTGVGQTFPAAQMSAAFAVSLACAEAYGFAADDVVTHQVWAPSRKIDPATAAAVEGPWCPPAVTSSGTWDLQALRTECRRLAAVAPPVPPPTPPVEDDMRHLIAPDRGAVIVGAGYMHWARDEEEGYEMALLYGPPVAVSTRDYDVLVHIHTSNDGGTP